MIFLLLVSLFGCAGAFSKTVEEQKKENFHIYLCFGQSNMEGSAEIEAQDKTVHPRFKMMSSVECPDSERSLGEWYAAVPPLSQCWVGFSPADVFGKTMVEYMPEGITDGVINVAFGGWDIRFSTKTSIKPLQASTLLRIGFRIRLKPMV